MSIYRFPDHSKVWIYQADRALSTTEKTWLEEQLSAFIAEWAAHGTKLMAGGEILGDYHLVLVVDETAYGASGCSIDSSVRFIKRIGAELNVDFFNRMNMLVEKEGAQQLVKFNELDQFSDWTLYNPLVQDLGMFRTFWKIPVSQRTF